MKNITKIELVSLVVVGSFLGACLITKKYEEKKKVFKKRDSGKEESKDKAIIGGKTE